MNVKDIRRENMRSLAKQVGGITKLAGMLGKSQSQISHVIGVRPIKAIGDRVASEVEKLFSKPSGWLDMPHHGVAETAGIYQEYQKNRTVPLLDWEHAITWQHGDKLTSNEYTMPIDPDIGLSSFALRLHGDSMDSPAGVSFPDGSIIIIDPEHTPYHGCYIVAQLPDSHELLFRQLSIEGTHYFLKPLNVRYPLKEIAGPEAIRGVARQMMFRFDQN